MRVTQAQLALAPELGFDEFEQWCLALLSLEPLIHLLLSEPRSDLGQDPVLVLIPLDGPERGDVLGRNIVHQLVKIVLFRIETNALLPLDFTFGAQEGRRLVTTSNINDSVVLKCGDSTHLNSILVIS